MTGLKRIIGQDFAVQRLKILSALFRRRGEGAEHILLVGADGMGKRTIARAFAEECGYAVNEVHVENWKTISDLASVVTAIERPIALLVPAIAGLHLDLWDPFGYALRQFGVYLLVGEGRKARMELRQLPRFACIATARTVSDCPPRLLDAFTMVLPIEPYSQPQLESIAVQIAREAGVSISPAVAVMIAGASGGFPRQIADLIQQLATLGPDPVTEITLIEVLSGFAPVPALSGHVQPSPDLDRLAVAQLGNLLTTLLDAVGLRTESTTLAPDGSIDLVAVLDKPLIGGRYLVRCETLAANKLVEASRVREFHAVVSADPKALKGILITTSGFTGQARDYAHEVGLELLDIEQFSSLIAGQEIEVGAPSRAAAASAR